MIPIYSPFLTSANTRFAKDAINSSWISSKGEYLQLAADELRNWLGIKHVLLVNNGTSAGHLVAKCLKYRYPEQKTVFTGDSVYVAAWNVFTYDKDFDVSVIDVDIDTWNVDLKLLEESVNRSKYKLVSLVHNLGNIIDITTLQREHPDWVIVEDACEALFGAHVGLNAGTMGLCASTSFFANKTATSGEGGAFLTNDDELYEYAKRLHGQGMSDTQYLHDYIGYNYRMTNIQAALLYGQLQDLDQILELKRVIFNRYNQEFSEIEELRIQKNLNEYPANWIYGIRWINSPGYDYVKKYMSDRQIETRPFFYPMAHHKAYGMHKWVYSERKNPIAELLHKEVFMIPSFPGLHEDEQTHIINSIKEMVRSV